MLVRVVLKALKFALPAKMRSKFHLSRTANGELYEQHAGRDQLPDFLGGGYGGDGGGGGGGGGGGNGALHVEKALAYLSQRCTKHALPGRPSWSRPMASASRSSTRAQSRSCRV